MLQSARTPTAGPPDTPTSAPATDQGDLPVRKVISFTHATLDGYIDAPHEWAFQYSDDPAAPTRSTTSADSGRPKAATSSPGGPAS
jgi:hypothetical protein